MKKSIFAGIACLVWACTGCGNQSKQSSESTDSVPTPAFAAEDSVSEAPEAPEVALIRGALQTILKDDLSKDLIPAEERRFSYALTDLNNDGTPECFVAPAGNYFAGSGGRTVYLLQSEGKVINRFTVVSLPIRIATKATKDWRDLVIDSNGESHLLQFNGKKYPSNPSMAPAYKTTGDSLTTVLSADLTPSYSY